MLVCIRSTRKKTRRMAATISTALWLQAPGPIADFVRSAATSLSRSPLIPPFVALSVSGRSFYVDHHRCRGNQSFWRIGSEQTGGRRVRRIVVATDLSARSDCVMRWPLPAAKGIPANISRLAPVAVALSPLADRLVPSRPPRPAIGRPTVKADRPHLTCASLGS